MDTHSVDGYYYWKNKFVKTKNGKLNIKLEGGLMQVSIKEPQRQNSVANIRSIPGQDLILTERAMQVGLDASNPL